MRSPIDNNSLSVPALNLPESGIKLLRTDSGFVLYDIFRKKNVAYTPEEWVRQNFLLWLVNHLGYPKGLIALEANIMYNKLPKRADAVVYDRLGNARMIIECKSVNIKLSQDTFLQAASYNSGFKCQYMVITNGLSHFCCKIDSDGQLFTFMDIIPHYSEL